MDEVTSIIANPTLSSDHCYDSSVSRTETDVRAIMKTTREYWLSETSSALESAEQSQIALGARLDELQKDMERAASVLSSAGAVGVSTTRAIRETQEGLLRSRRKLTTIRARVGRLRSLEQAERFSAMPSDGRHENRND